MAEKTKVYCKYCGGTDIKRIIQTNEMARSKMFKPEIGADLGSATIRGSLGSISDSERVTHEFDSTMCYTCLNTCVLNPDNNLPPVSLESHSPAPDLVMPHLLVAELHSHKYSLEDIYHLIVDNAVNLKRVHTKWARLGSNPCKKNRLGFRTTLRLPDRTKLVCWIIMDYVGEKLAYRLIYGGGDVKCD